MPIRSRRKRGWRWCGWFVVWFFVGWVTFVGLPSIMAVREVLAGPLIVPDAKPRAETAYVMSAGPAYYERLRAAADLYHARRVKRIYLADDRSPAGHNFVRGRLETRVEQSVGVLGCLGVPSDAVDKVEVPALTMFGSLNEARAFAATGAAVRSSVIVVTSAAHTRRSRLSFRRSLPAETNVNAVAATSLGNSAEAYHPLWIEYAKLLVYYVVA